LLCSIGTEDDDEEEVEAVAQTPVETDGTTEETGDKPAKKAKQELPQLSAEEVAELTEDTLNYDIAVLEEQLNGRKPNMSAIAQFYKKEKDYLARVAELDTVTAARDTVRAHYEVRDSGRLIVFGRSLCLWLGLAQAASGHVHGRFQYHHQQTQGDVPNDNPWWRR
jgi:structural maintenance of chromosome 4